MLMHSCYCVFISVTGGFVQMLKDLKNLLKMSLKILFIKRKRKNEHLPPLSHFGLLAQLPDGPLPSLPSTPPILLPGPAQFRRNRCPRASPAPRPFPARQSLPKRARLSALSPTSSRTPRPVRQLPLRNRRPAPAPRDVGASPRSTASLKGSQDPPHTPAAFSPLSFRTCSGRRSRNNRRSTRRIHRARAAVPVASPSRLALSRALP